MAASVLTRLRKWLLFDPISIPATHYDVIKKHLRPKTAAQRAEITFFSNNFELYAKKALQLVKLRAAVYILFYAAFIIINVLNAIPFLRFLVTFFELGSYVLGSGAAVILLFYLTIRINLHLQRMNVCLMHLVHFYHANNKRDERTSLQQLSKVL